MLGGRYPVGCNREVSERDKDYCVRVSVPIDVKAWRMYKFCVGVHCVAVAVCIVGSLRHLRFSGVRYDGYGILSIAYTWVVQMLQCTSCICD